MEGLELLKDPCNDRMVKSVKPPACKPLETKALFPNGENGKINIDLLGQHLLLEGKLTKKDVMTIINRVDTILDKEPNLLYLYDPITIVGDIHGQFHDMMRMFSLSSPDFGSRRWLFLGDYVDRGKFSIEVVMYLFALKINFPNNIYMLRGNHETREVTTAFNFREECLLKYDQEIYEYVMEVFDV